MNKLKLRKVCIGVYITTNASTEFTVQRSDWDNQWYITSGDYEGDDFTGLFQIEPTKKDCVQYLEDINRDFNSKTHSQWFEIN